MTPAERLALQRLNRRAAELTPELVAAILKAMQLVRDRMPLGEVERLIRAGRLVDAVNVAVPIEVLERALNPATNVLAEGVVRTARLTSPTLPTAARTIVADMNTLNPRVLDAIRALDTKQIRAMIPEVQQAVRQTIEAGLQRGLNPRTVARSLQRTVGLAPNQEQAVRNFRAMLEGGPRTPVLKGATEAALRDRRFDSVIARARASGTPLTEAQVDRMVDAYARRMRAFAAETHARTAALDAQKVGQQLAWDEAKQSGALGDSEVVAVWVTAGDARVRDDHAAMNGEERPIDGAYSTGQRYPGENEFNCRCTEIFRVRKPRFAMAA